MKFAHKLTLAIVLPLCVALSAGGTWSIHQNFRAALDAAARTFDGHLAKLHRACQALDGRPLKQGDAGYEILAFDCMPLQFVFWDGDDEFPAQGNILFDVSATDFIHGESVVTIAAIGLERIVKLAGVPMDRSTFPIF